VSPGTGGTLPEPGKALRGAYRATRGACVLRDGRRIFGEWICSVATLAWILHGSPLLGEFLRGGSRFRRRPMRRGIAPLEALNEPSFLPKRSTPISYSGP
jgi:hypothetical protein